MNLFFRAKPKIPASTLVTIDGEAVSVTVRVNARARSYRLSLPHSGGPLLTLPPHGKWSEAPPQFHQARKAQPTHQPFE